jgi:hypothetical protein
MLTYVFATDGQINRLQSSPYIHVYFSCGTYMDDPFLKPVFTIGNSYDGTNYIYKDDMIKRVEYNGDMH